MGVTMQLREVRRSLRAYPGFAAAVLITLAVAGLIGLMTFVMILRPGFLGMAHGSEPHHRIHDLTYGFIFTTALVGILFQLRRPSKNIAGMLMALIPFVALLLAAVLSADAGVILSTERLLVLVGTVTVALLHPARGHFFRSFRVSRINWIMLPMVAIAAVPLLSFAIANLDLQGELADEHAGLGHYGFMAAFSLTVIGVGLLASWRPEGWRPTAWVAGLLPVFLGVASLMNPDAPSRLGTGWAFAAIAWGVVFIASAVFVRPADGSMQRSAVAVGPGEARAREEETLMPEPPSDPRPGMPRWLKVSGIVVAALVVLAVALMLTGVLGEHGPGQFGPGQHGP
jgi:hypothetical protein